MINKKSAALIILIFLFTSRCASIDEQTKKINSVVDTIIEVQSLKNQIPEESQLITMDQLRIVPGYNYIPVRADIVRREEKTGEEKNSCLGFSYKEDVYEPVDYKNIGLNLGNGLFIDSNMNLSLDLADVTGFNKMENCTLTITDESFSGEKFVIEKRGNKIKILEGKIWPDRTDVILKENGATIDRGFFSANRNIVLSDSSAAFKQGGIFGFLNNEELKKNGNSYRIPGVLTDKEFAVIENDGSLIFNGNIFRQGNTDNVFNSAGNLRLKKEGKKISISCKGQEFYFVKSRNKIIFYEKRNYSGVILEINGDEIIYTQNGILSSIVQKIKIERG